MNWKHYRTVMARELSHLDLKYKSVTELEESVELVGQARRLTYESSCNLKVPECKQSAFWWSRERQEQRAEVRMTFNMANFTENEQD